MISVDCCWDDRGDTFYYRDLGIIGLTFYTRTCDIAAEYGHLHILKYAKEHRCRWNEKTCEKAAKNGHLHILKYAREHGCEWDAHTCHMAALNGHLHILQFARE